MKNKPKLTPGEKKLIEFKKKFVFRDKNGVLQIASYIIDGESVFSWITQALHTQRQEFKKMVEGIKVINPPKDVKKLRSKRQAFIGGEMNVIMRLYNILKELESQSKLL